MRSSWKLALIGGEVTVLAAFTGLGIHLAIQPHRTAFRPPPLVLPSLRPPREPPPIRLRAVYRSAGTLLPDARSVFDDRAIDGAAHRRRVWSVCTPILFAPGQRPNRSASAPPAAPSARPPSFAA